MKKKILFLIPNLKHGGAEKVLVNLVNNMDPEKYDITVQTLFDEGVHRESLKSHVRYLPGMKRSFRGNTTLLKCFPAAFLWKRLVKEHYDIAVSYLEGPTSRILSGCTDPSTRRIAWLHIELNTPQKAALGFRSAGEAERAYNSFDGIVAVSRNVRECFLAQLKVTTPVSVLYNTNETEEILEKCTEEPNDPAFLPGDQLSVCSVAKLTATKGFDRLLSALQTLKDRGITGHHVTVLGDGYQREFLEQTVRDYGLEDVVDMPGHVDNPYAILRQADLFALPSRDESFSLAVAEAMVLGIPVMSTRCTGPVELLKDGEAGCLVENSEEGILAGLEKILTDPDYYRELQEKARRNTDNFDIDRQIALVEDLLDGA